MAYRPHADEVSNQSPPFADVNLFASDQALREAVAREGGSAAHAELEAHVAPRLA